MRPSRSFMVKIPILLPLLLALACNFGGSELSGTAVTATFKARSTSMMATARAATPKATPAHPTVRANTPTKAPPTETYTPADTATPADTPTPTATVTSTVTLTVVHLVTPGNPTGTTRYMTDPITKDYAAEMRAPSGADYYLGNKYERPFSVPGMAYLPDVDITRAELRIAFPWLYATIFLAGPRAEGIGQTMYGVEIDRNRDGRGDFLIWGPSPSSTDWTTDGVQVWKDTNNDVGGLNPQVSEAPFAGNGYDQSLFSSGQGADPDMAWIRQLDGGAKVQLAFKYSVIGESAQFLWNAIADSGVRRPEWFDYNDHFTQAEAGSPLKAQTDLYPLKLLFGVDNTCHDPFGFLPTGGEPGLCELYGSISGRTCYDLDSDGKCSAAEDGVGSETITLGQGGCPSAGFRTATTSAEGGYFFGELPAGKYCLGYTSNSGRTAVVSNPAAITLAPGEARLFNWPVAP